MRVADVRRVYSDLERRLKGKGVKPPRLVDTRRGGFTVSGLMFVFFGERLGRVGTKAELSEFLKKMKCKTCDPQPRHLGMQRGLNFLVQGCWHPKLRRVLRQGEYSLLDVRNVHPTFKTRHRSQNIGPSDFDRIKSSYDMRCVSCGSKEGEKNYKNAHLITALEKGHCDPRKPLTEDNCVPMCTLCNRVYKNSAVFNKNGFIVAWLGSQSRKTVEKADVVMSPLSVITRTIDQTPEKTHEKTRVAKHRGLAVKRRELKMKSMKVAMKTMTTTSLRRSARIRMQRMRIV